VEDEGRLTNHRIREAFLTSIYALARFRAVKAQDALGPLVKFHERHKLLLMAYRQASLRAMGPVVANHEHRPAGEVIAAYEPLLREALARPVRRPAAINVLMHALGYFRQGLQGSEKAFFLQSLEDYRAGRVPLSVPVSVLRAWIVRFEQDYLREQHFFAPYPEGLVQITDSGKGRDLD
jgi:uncharacterized protein YbgA (DUF1722 family)